jgi:hypothetical protein
VLPAGLVVFRLLVVRFLAVLLLRILRLEHLGDFADMRLQLLEHRLAAAQIEAATKEAPWLEPLTVPPP